jgi:hypothetical protein
MPTSNSNYDIDWHIATLSDYIDMLEECIDIYKGYPNHPELTDISQEELMEFYHKEVDAANSNSQRVETQRAIAYSSVCEKSKQVADLSHAYSDAVARFTAVLIEKNLM